MIHDYVCRHLWLELTTSVQKISPKPGISISERVSIRQIAHESRVLEGHIGRAEVSVGESRLRSSRQALPRNQWLLAALRTREPSPEDTVSIYMHKIESQRL
jgi:hypothetical protein